MQARESGNSRRRLVVELWVEKCVLKGCTQQNF
jgi:hypothetical protein